MRRYLSMRLLTMLPLAIMISFFSFALLHLAPSDPAEVALRVNDVVPTDAAIASMRQELGLAQPFLMQYVNWLWDCLHLDFGRSFITKEPVALEFARALPATLYLACTTLLIVGVFSVGFGVLCATAENSAVDKIVRSVVFITTSMPNYWVGLLLIWLLSVKLDLLPVGGMLSPESIILPAIALSLAYVGTYIRLIRGGMVGNMRKNFVFYARARGLPERVIVWKHVFVNSIQSSIIAIGMSIPKLIAGTVVIENIFAWPGLGRLCVTAIFNRDYPVIQAYVLLMALLFLTFNFLTDVLNVRLDPRLRPGR